LIAVADQAALCHTDAAQVAVQLIDLCPRKALAATCENAPFSNCSYVCPEPVLGKKIAFMYV
jgi:hypothetical protein